MTPKVIAPVSVEEVLEQLGIHVVSTGREISARCPFHEDKHPSFSINARSGLWICYQCGQSGTLQMLLQKVAGKDVNPVELLREVRHKAVGKQKVVEEEEPVEIDPFVLYARYESFSMPPVWAQEGRFLTPAAVEAYGVKWEKGWVIPIWAPEVNDEAVDFWGWQFKRLDFVSNYPKAVKKSQTLFGLRELDTTTFALVESPLDVVRLAAVGIPAVSSYGVMVSNTQIRLLIDRADRLVLALDNDEEGKKQTAKLFPKLARVMATTVAELPAGAKDPGDLDNEQAIGIFHDIPRRAVRLPDRGQGDDAGPPLVTAGASHGPRQNGDVDSSDRGAD